MNLIVNYEVSASSRYFFSLRPKHYLGTPFLKTLTATISLGSDEVSLPYKTQNSLTVSYTLKENK
jgi:hypothetical protein